MDTVTHALLGALVVRSVFPAAHSRQPLTDRQRMAVGAIAGAFPDIDYIASWVDPMVYMTLWHRSITHSFVLLPLWALLVGVVLALAFKQRRAWPLVTLLAAVAIISHILADLITVFGTQIFAPLSGWRASIGTTFIIDPWFSAIVLTGFLAGPGKRTP
ncbi:MAG: metal-dependent hydrolase [Thiogranum sp.]